MQEIERMVTHRQAAEAEGRGITTIYKRLARGEYDAVKDGKSTLILWSSVLRRRASLPKPHTACAKARSAFRRSLRP